MKKILLMAAALFALAAVAFAKPAKAPKLNGWKDVAKIADKNDFEVASDYTDMYVAKSKDGKEFAFFAVKDYADIKVTVAMSCVDGAVFSKTTCVDKEQSQPLPIFTIGENDEKCVLVNGGDLTYYYGDDALQAWTEECKNQRSKLREEVANEFGLVLPKK